MKTSNLLLDIVSLIAWYYIVILHTNLLRLPVLTFTMIANFTRLNAIPAFKLTCLLRSRVWSPLAAYTLFWIRQ